MNKGELYNLLGAWEQRAAELNELEGAELRLDELIRCMAQLSNVLKDHTDG